MGSDCSPTYPTFLFFDRSLFPWLYTKTLFYYAKEDNSPVQALVINDKIPVYTENKNNKIDLASPFQDSQYNKTNAYSHFSNRLL